jgi:hypothetical protein
MRQFLVLSHVIYKYDYHIVWVPKYRFRILTGQIKLLMESDIRMLCEWTAIIPAGLVYDKTVSACDIFPTVLADGTSNGFDFRQLEIGQ